MYRYNDLNQGDVLKTGEVIYIKPKRNKAAEEYHVVKKGDTMRGISQAYGIKLKQLYKKNVMILGTQPKIGDKLNLKKKKK